MEKRRTSSFLYIATGMTLLLMALCFNKTATTANWFSGFAVLFAILSVGFPFVWIKFNFVNRFHRRLEWFFLGSSFMCLVLYFVWEKFI